MLPPDHSDRAQERVYLVEHASTGTGIALTADMTLWGDAHPTLAAPLPAGTECIKINDEYMRVIPGSPDRVERAWAGSVPAAHTAGATVWPIRAVFWDAGELGDTVMATPDVRAGVLARVVPTFGDRPPRYTVSGQLGRTGSLTITALRDTALEIALVVSEWCAECSELWLCADAQHRADDSHAEDYSVPTLRARMHCHIGRASAAPIHPGAREYRVEAELQEIGTPDRQAAWPSWSWQIYEYDFSRFMEHPGYTGAEYEYDYSRLFVFPGYTGAAYDFDFSREAV